ncbi:MAG: metallophosphoesterase [Syntrophorhabdaceae bacterium]|nr:metallophosphoesterase [Syntrophorhabdaceae bacterium]
MDKRKRKWHRIVLPLCLINLFLFFVPVLYSVGLSSFAIIGDTRIGPLGNVYVQFIDRVKKMGIDTIFITGDVIDRPGKEEEWRKFLELTGGLTFHIAPGNHDINNQRSLKVYNTIIGKDPYYSFASDDTLFIILCTDLPEEIGRITGKQLSWLKAELEKNYRFKMVFLHKPLFTTVYGRGYGLDAQREERDFLHNLFLKNGVDAVFAGHEHLYNRTEKDGILYVITGGGGARLLTSSEEDGGFYHYIVAKKDREGYIFTVYDLQGKVRDRFSVKK